MEVKAGRVRREHCRLRATPALSLPSCPTSQVASRCGVEIPTGCLSGSCGICEVEFRKYQTGAVNGGSSGSTPAAAAVIRACIAKLPPGYDRIEITEMMDAWNQDGFDT